MKQRISWEVIVFFIMLFIFLSIFVIAIAYVNSPTEFVFRIEMDNNTLEAFKSINYTALNVTK